MGRLHRPVDTGQRKSPSNGSITGRRLQEFQQLSRAEVVQAVRDLAAMGFGDYSISHATGLSVEVVREFLARRAGR